MKLFRFLYFFLLFACVSSNLFAEPPSASFKPSWWCRGGHLQTIAGGLFRRHPKVPLTRERLNISEEQFLTLDWLAGDPARPLVVILHGLGSTADVSYVHSLFRQIQKSKWRGVAIHELSHGGNTEGVRAAVTEFIRRGNKEIYLVGYSLGGNVILKWLGEEGSSVPSEVKRAAAVSVPYDLRKAAQHLDRGFNREVYARLMLGGLIKEALEHEQKFPGSINVSIVREAKTFQVFDREVTARLHGFKDEYDYWDQSSAVNYLEKIKIPVLLVHAENDPFFPKKDMPLEPIERSPNLKLLLTSDGGHLGFVSGANPFREKPWLGETALNYFMSEK